MIWNWSITLRIVKGGKNSAFESLQWQVHGLCRASIKSLVTEWNDFAARFWTYILRVGRQRDCEIHFTPQYGNLQSAHSP